MQGSSQSSLNKERAVGYQGRHPTPALDAVDLFSKYTIKVMHQQELLQAKVKDCRTANKTLSDHRNHKKSRLQTGGSLLYERPRL